VGVGSVAAGIGSEAVAVSSHAAEKCRWLHFSWPSTAERMRPFGQHFGHLCLPRNVVEIWDVGQWLI